MYIYINDGLPFRNSSCNWRSFTLSPRGERIYETEVPSLVNEIALPLLSFQFMKRFFLQFIKFVPNLFFSNCSCEIVARTSSVVQRVRCSMKINSVPLGTLISVSRSRNRGTEKDCAFVYMKQRIIENNLERNNSVLQFATIPTPIVRV